MQNMLRRFSFSSSFREFIRHISDELFTAGEGIEHPGYYTVYGKSIRVEVKSLQRPHSPVIELMFMGMLCILATMIFKCAACSMKPKLFDISVGCLYINICLAAITVLLVCLEFRKLYKIEPA
ncbi:hypothetical protein NEAUS04_1112 [Nematocida ausubeli]|uniref:Uncharacterized protein n=1 Tax=Nematocida ausubeli (strain ATCC PRA-371 / ERTm2) TaxID=1913371 RepID=A0A086J0M8_NEMA1|nr:uncharacterized protein NESG_01675 [Nematocida ausubeli]KAI5136391.1 hypothetical protein NEAUS06_1892 [Nematocida ausubeli]KAI5137661.1 hypothetical protein NEAUS07_2089 [Nematocida ausubeli]KAI5148640.1 hypothetical protein NEAUS05_1462 [Nematocida ausubeli]KAI5162723.1 hypothetical protein NEAUS04_1112 [Nematocida ausubeli]KFG25696.1 hypothetical protein NESG_01675 [Nematocida ausubeli]